MKINKKIIGIFIISTVLGGSILLKFYSKPKNLKSYDILKISLENNRGYINASGKVEANDTKDVFVDKKLKVDEVFIQEGDFVKKGQLLMTFDDTERNNIKRNLERKNIKLNRDKRNLKIIEELYKIGGSSTNEIKDLKEEIRLLEIDIEEYNEDLSKTAEKILSPVSGTISSLKAQANYLVDTDQALLKIMDLSNIKIILEIPEYDIKNIKLNQELVLKPEVFENKKEFKGTITKIAKVSKSSSTTSENVVEVEVMPLEEIPNIIPGFKVSATIYLDENKNKIIIPKTSILEDNKKYYVFVVDKEGILSKKYIEIKSLEGDKVIVLKGLNIGDHILKTPFENLKEGDKVLASNIAGGDKQNDDTGSKSK
ncbi:efflux RND transporter periplasmic adaptor subunit [Fusobacterium sp. MFO224]|uniref:efflux RND transporter periplasmic adaptor subunit n=1 Tax=Fusobacterium sp. MFO224 TaxID=3378070 RepID=UPI0038539F81